ncbi:MAG: hypothetical protein LQ344_006832 [Seirophora lacunosa]|nr:MAG: hypothetical protein LQ344_006832 [Seirophora lacunosa]
MENMEKIDTKITIASNHSLSNILSVEVCDDGVYMVMKDGPFRRKMHHFEPGEEIPTVQSSTANAPGRERLGPFGFPISEGPALVAITQHAKRTLQEIENEFEQHRQEWERSEAMAALKDTMAIIVKEHHFENVISFGLGSLQSVAESERRCSQLETAAMLTVMECINDGRDGTDLVRCFSQDPEYSDLDKQVLRSHGIEPVDDPQGFSLIGKNSMCCEWSGYKFVTTTLSEAFWGRGRGANVLSDAELELIANMVRGFERKPFPKLQVPEGDGHSPFFGYYIYWRKTQEVIGDGQNSAETERA